MYDHDHVMHSAMTTYIVMLYVYVHLLAYCMTHAQCDHLLHRDHVPVQCYVLGLTPDHSALPHHNVDMVCHTHMVVVHHV